MHRPPKTLLLSSLLAYLDGELNYAKQEKASCIRWTSGWHRADNEVKLLTKIKKEIKPRASTPFKLETFKELKDRFGHAPAPIYRKDLKKRV